MNRIMVRKNRKSVVGPARLNEIAELAEAVAEEHCPTDQVRPTEIARAKGITMSFGAYGQAFDGMLESAAGRFHIYCNTQSTGAAEAPRTRFTLAHELGHYYIDEHRRALQAGRAIAHRSTCEYESPNVAEQEADHFAANLLMPARRFMTVAKKARRAGLGLGGVLALAGRFQTSITSTAIRYAAAEVAPCAVIKWTWRGYAWKWLSSSTFEARLRKTFEAFTDLPEDCPTRRALARQPQPQRGYFEAGTTASAWFPAVGPGDFRDAVFIEQAVSLGRFGVLTFLYPQQGGYMFGKAR